MQNFHYKTEDCYLCGTTGHVALVEEDKKMGVDTYYWDVCPCCGGNGKLSIAVPASNKDRSK